MLSSIDSAFSPRFEELKKEMDLLNLKLNSALTLKTIYCVQVIGYSTSKVADLLVETYLKNCYAKDILKQRSYYEIFMKSCQEKGIITTDQPCPIHLRIW